MLYLSADPGDITGLAAWEHDFFWAKEGPAEEIMLLIHQKVRHESMLNGSHTGHRDASGRCILVVEGVTLPNRSHLPEKQFGQTGTIGAMHWLAIRYKIEMINYQPGQRKVITNEMLQKLGWYKPSPGKHMVDAAKHLVLAKLKNGELQMEDLV